MTHDEFVNEYTEVAWLALRLSMIARREGLLALEVELKNMGKWKLFQRGLRLVVDGTDEEIIDKILSNKIKQEKDEYTAALKNIQKEAVLILQEGLNPRLLYYVLNSYTGIPFKEDEVFKKLEEAMEKEEG